MIGILITRDQIETWAGRSLSDDELDRLDEALPHSTLPDTVGLIVDGFEYHVCEYINGRPETHTLCSICGCCDES